jgi:hypothetical protein
MMSRFAKLMFAAGTLALVAGTISSAEAQSRRYRGERPTVVIKKRSFLDSGTVVPVGSLNNYVSVGGIAETNDNLRGRYGRETLPRRFDLPGSRPQFDF